MGEGGVVGERMKGKFGGERDREDDVGRKG